jgi:hypothetical protein
MHKKKWGRHRTLDRKIGRHELVVALATGKGECGERAQVRQLELIAAIAAENGELRELADVEEGIAGRLDAGRLEADLVILDAVKVRGDLEDLDVIGQRVAGQRQLAGGGVVVHIDEPGGRDAGFERFDGGATWFHDEEWSEQVNGS